MGDFPMMTENGTFVYNGAERVVVTQLVRSPGAYYAREKLIRQEKNFSLPPLFQTVVLGWSMRQTLMRLFLPE